MDRDIYIKQKHRFLTQSWIWYFTALFTGRGPERNRNGTLGKHCSWGKSNPYMNNSIPRRCDSGRKMRQWGGRTKDLEEKEVGKMPRIPFPPHKYPLKYSCYLKLTGEGTLKLVTLCVNRIGRGQGKGVIREENMWINIAAAEALQK